VRWGLTAGVGTEWALNRTISIKTEALYIRFSEESSSHTSLITVGAPETKRFDHEDAMWVARVGLNIKLGGF
jgi:hypothetical protein